MEKLYSSRNPLIRFVCDKRLEKIVKIIPKGKPLRILDAGCGEGQLLFKISKINSGELYGFDVAEVAIERAKEKVRGANFSLQHLENLDYGDNFFDVVICTEVIEHISNYNGAIKELKRVLKKDGLLIITFPNEPLAFFLRLMFFRKPTIEDHVNSFSPRKIKEAVSLRLKSKINIPFQIFDFLSIVHIMAFTK